MSSEPETNIVKNNLRRIFLYIKIVTSLLKYCRHGSRAGVLDTFEGHGAPITGVSAHYGQGTLDFSHLFLTASMDWTVKLWSLKVTCNNENALDIPEGLIDKLVALAGQILFLRIIIVGKSLASLFF